MKGVLYETATGNVVAIYDDCPLTGVANVPPGCAWFRTSAAAPTLEKRLVTGAVAKAELDEPAVVAATASQKRLVITRTPAGRVALGTVATVTVKCEDDSGVVAVSAVVTLTARWGDDILSVTPVTLVAGTGSADITVPEEFPYSAAHDARVACNLGLSVICAAEPTWLGGTQTIDVDERLQVVKAVVIEP